MLDFDSVYNRKILVTDLHRNRSELHSISHSYNVIPNDWWTNYLCWYYSHFNYFRRSDSSYYRIQYIKRIKSWRSKCTDSGKNGRFRHTIFAVARKYNHEENERSSRKYRIALHESMSGCNNGNIYALHGILSKSILWAIVFWIQLAPINLVLSRNSSCSNFKVFSSVVRRTWEAFSLSILFKHLSINIWHLSSWSTILENLIVRINHNVYWLLHQICFYGHLKRWSGWKGLQCRWRR